MAPYSRLLLFPQPTAGDTAPMWDRPSNRSPIFVDPVAPSSQMWDRDAQDSPIFIDAIVPTSPMWNRPAATVPMCPCCTSIIARPDMVDARPTTEARRPSVSSRRSQRSLRSMPSALGLRLRKSIRNLRSKTSTQSLW